MRTFRTYAAAVALIALLGAGCAPQAPATNGNENTNTELKVGTVKTKPASGAYTVSIKTDNSFDPTTIFVKYGTAVTWRNDDTAPHLICSNEDPRNANKPILPDLGCQTPIPPGGTYTYTFKNEGRWNYYDKLNTAFGGAVVVVE